MTASRRDTLRSPIVGGGDRLDLHARATLTDGSAAAVVATDGTIEWWCPVIDADPVLARLLDGRGGAIRLGFTNGAASPATEGLLTTGLQRRSGRQVVTTISAGDAVVELRDDVTDNIVTRLLTVVRGDATVGWSWAPRAAAGTVARAGLAHRRWAAGMSVGRCVVHVRVDDGAELAEGDAVTLPTGARVVMGMAIVGVDGLPVRTRSTLDLHADRTRARLDAAADRWERENGDVDYDGPFRSRLVAAVSQLRMATGASGGVIRALTTSLPRGIGNERNFDDRYAWIDDAARTVRVWERLDRPDLADRTRSWVASALGELDDVPAPVRTVEGAPPPGAREADLHGWRGHRPVRVGTDAANRVDLGSIAAASLVLDARHHPRQLRAAAAWLAGQVTDGVPRADHGRWNQQGPTARHVAGALAIDTALRSASASARRRDPLDLEAWSWIDTADEIRHWLMATAVTARGTGGHWRRTPEDSTTDAMLLRVVAPAEGSPPDIAGDGEGDARRRAAVTVDLVIHQLGEGFALHRHLPHVDDGVPPGQAPDLGASFEAVTALASVRRWDEAHTRMGSLLSACSSWLQLPATIDPRSGAAGGNLADTPAALGLIEAALALRAGPR